MSDQRRGGIAWTTETWNPIRGCSRVSAGCVNCYAERQAIRMAGPGQAYDGLVRMTSQGPKWTGRIAIAESKIGEPHRWTRPRKIFVNSMSDIFHESLADSDIDDIFRTMWLAAHHTYQVLTKRADRMHRYLSDPQTPWRIAAITSVSSNVDRSIAPIPWPLPNVWIGVSVEDQQRASERIPLVLRAPAAVRWISAEPLLGPLSDLRGIWNHCPEHDFASGFCIDRRHLGVRWLDWVVVGGESGPGARPMALGWAKDIVRQCRRAGVPVFVKQIGAHPTNREGELHPISDRAGKNPDDWPAELRVREWPL